MDQLKLLRKRVKAMWAMESQLSPNERKLHQWQILAEQSGIHYLVGKGDANTFFYKVGHNGKMKYVMPDKMMAILDKWCGAKFLLYAITKGRDISDAVTSTRLDTLLSITKDKYVGYSIAGVMPDRKVVRLYTLQTGLRENQWVPVKLKGKKQ